MQPVQARRLQPGVLERLQLLFKFQSLEIHFRNNPSNPYLGGTTHGKKAAGDVACSTSLAWHSGGLGSAQAGAGRPEWPAGAQLPSILLRTLPWSTSLAAHGREGEWRQFQNRAESKNGQYLVNRGQSSSVDRNRCTWEAQALTEEKRLTRRNACAFFEGGAM